MIPLTTLCDEFIDRSKLNEQKVHLSTQLFPTTVDRNKNLVFSIALNSTKKKIVAPSIQLLEANCSQVSSIKSPSETKKLSNYSDSPPKNSTMDNTIPEKFY